MCGYCQVQFGMIEIYNEKVRDLLNTGKAPAGGLQVREDAKRGLFYGIFAPSLDMYTLVITASAAVSMWMLNY